MITGQQQNSAPPTVEALEQGLLERLMVLRRWFHQHPELSYHEVETAKRIIAELERLGIPCKYPGVGHAIIGTIEGANPGAPE